MQKLSFNRDWRFWLGGPTFGREEPPQSGWQSVTLPHDWSIGLPRAAQEPSGVSNGFFPMGRGWYRKTFDVPESWRGQQVLIEFEGVYMNAEVWLDENYLGRHPYGYTTFTFDLTPYLRIGQPNTLKVMVDNSQQLNSRWYSGSGIYRPVWLHVGAPVHVAHWGVAVTTPQVSAKEASVVARTQVENAHSQPVEISLTSRIVRQGQEKPAAQAETSATVRPGTVFEFEQTLAVASPKRWSVETPHLYDLISEVRIGGELVDEQTTPFGIRSIEVSAERGFLLNGQEVKLKGGCVHHDNGIVGAAAFARSEERKVAIHKASGYNAIRCAHNPPSPAFLDACDRLGMLVMDEAFDCWRDGKNHGDYHLSFDDWWQRDVESMVLRDRNHPCIIMWSIGNETMERDGRSGGVQIAKMLSDEVRRLDPTRPITAAICGVWDKARVWTDTDPVFASLDAGGYNYQWREYESDHVRVPSRVMMGTESIAKESFENWKSVTDHTYVIGDFVWTSLDYFGESGIGRVVYGDEKPFLGQFPWHISNCGDLDITGCKRPQSYYRDLLWGVGKPVYMAVVRPGPEGQAATVTFWGWPDEVESWTWAGLEGKSLTVDVYSSAEQVELFLNGESLGVKPTTPAERHTASFDVPYTPGELRAAAFIGGKLVGESVLQTVGKPAALRLTAEDTAITTAEGDLAYVTVEVLDAQGRRDPTAHMPIYFTAEGEGSVFAVGSADPLSTERYQGNQRSAFLGRALVVLRGTGMPGQITLRAQADGLSPAEVTVQVHS